jgi:hypothetical protein
MAVPAPLGQNESPEELQDPIQLTAAELYAQGLKRGQIARRMETYLITPLQAKRPPLERRRYAHKKLRRWEKRKQFRDLVWELSVQKLDMRANRIIDGVAARGEAGRVDAAKLSLEIAGRYVPKGHDTPTTVAIMINGVPRPQGEVIEGQIISEEDEA